MKPYDDVHEELADIQRQLSDLQEQLEKRCKPLDKYQQEQEGFEQVIGEHVGLLWERGVERLRHRAVKASPHLLEGRHSSFQHAMQQTYRHVSQESAYALIVDSAVGQWLASPSSPMGGITGAVRSSGGEMERGPPSSSVEYAVQRTGKQLMTELLHHMAGMKRYL